MPGSLLATEIPDLEEKEVYKVKVKVFTKYGKTKESKEVTYTVTGPGEYFIQCILYNLIQCYLMLGTI